MEKVQQAVKFNDVFVTVGDTIIVKPQRYINNRERCAVLENNNIAPGSVFSAKVCSIGPNAFELDASQRYESRRFSLGFDEIASVKQLGPEEVLDC